MKQLATRPEPSPKRRPTLPHAESGSRVEMLFAHLKRILKLDRLRLRRAKRSQR